MYNAVVNWINFQRLLCFRTVAREVSIARACKQLRLIQPTISARIRALENDLGEKLFSRSGRGRLARMREAEPVLQNRRSEA